MLRDLPQRRGRMITMAYLLSEIIYSINRVLSTKISDSSMNFRKPLLPVNIYM